jgi:hypothetical protein
MKNKTNVKVTRRPQQVLSPTKDKTAPIKVRGKFYNFSLVYSNKLTHEPSPFWQEIHLLD